MNVIRTVAFATCALLSACGKPLGTYEVRNVSLVQAAAAKKEADIDPDPQMLRVEFTSKTDLYRASDGGHEGLYVFASFCPFQDESPVSVTAPYYNDRPRYDPATHADRRPIKSPATGEYVYTTYLRLSGKPSLDRGDGRSNFTRYDLRHEQHDLCLRIEHPGYFITPSRSGVFILPSAMIKRALLNAAAG